MQRESEMSVITLRSVDLSDIMDRGANTLYRRYRYWVWTSMPKNLRHRARLILLSLMYSTGFAQGLHS